MQVRQSEPTGGPRKLWALLVVGQVEGEDGVYAPPHVSTAKALGYSLCRRRLVFEEVLELNWMEEKTLACGGP